MRWDNFLVPMQCFEIPVHPKRCWWERVDWLIIVFLTPSQPWRLYQGEKGGSCHHDQHDCALTPVLPSHSESGFFSGPGPNNFGAEKSKAWKKTSTYLWIASFFFFSFFFFFCVWFFSTSTQRNRKWARELSLLVGRKLVGKPVSVWLCFPRQPPRRVRGMRTLLRRRATWAHRRGMRSSFFTLSQSML